MVITFFLHSCSIVNHLKAPNVMFDSGIVVENIIWSLGLLTSTKNCEMYSLHDLLKHICPNT